MGSPRQMFKKKVLAASVAALASVSYSAIAQDAPVEEVLVTGIRASLENAMDIKRDSSGVVDAISAEDIGKMPDANLAESLQRIAGVSISRTNGEGAQVTVRGIDPALNMVTLNGRNMPTVTNNGNTGDKASRAFDFANLASESVSGVEVYKTGNATVSGGGLGAAINLKTLRPLDAGAKASFGVKAVQDTTVYRGEQGDEITPEVSGLYSWVNDEDTFGVSLTAAYQVRDNVRSNAFVNNWQLKTAGAPTYVRDNNGTVNNPDDDFDTTELATSDGTLPAGANIVNAPAAGQLYALPTDLRYALEENHRERTNSQLTVQFRPVDNFTATLDYTFAKNDLEAYRAQQSTWYNISAISAATFDTGHAVATPIIYQETYGGGKDVSFAQQQYTSVSLNNSFGMNFEWNVTDSFTLELDYHDSGAENETYRPEMGLNANIVTGNYSRWDTDLPVMGITFDDSDPTKGNDNGIVDGGDVSGAIGTVQWDKQNASVEQLQLMGKLELDQFAFFNDSKVSFGVQTREESNSTLVQNGEGPRITMGNWGGVDPDAFGSNWPNYFTARDFAEGFDQSGATGNPNFLHMGLQGDFGSIVDALEYANSLAQTAIKFQGDDPTTMDDPDTTDRVENVEDWYWVSAANYDAAKESATPWIYRENNLNPDNFNNFPGGKYKLNGITTLNRTIQEDVDGFYLAFNGGFDLAGMEANLGLGIRYEDTTVHSTSIVSETKDLRWDGDNDWSTVAGTGRTVLSQKSSYDNVLPNIDFDINVTDDVKLRASYSTTMARPSYNDLKTEVTITNVYQQQTRAGNPELVAMESNNFDLSAEWYYDDGSYVSAAYFIKDVSNFIGTEVVSESAYGLTDLRNSDAYNNAAVPATDEEGKFNAVCGAGNKDCTSAWYLEQHPMETLPLVMWDQSQPVNSQDAQIDGLELSVQHWFGDTGFGVQANYTMVDSDLTFDDTSTAAQFALIGLSDTANLVAIYENYGFQARLAYNWRDKFLSSTNQGGNNAPGYTEEYSQLDLSLGYEVNENVSLTFEGLNITGEDYRVHGRSEAQMFNFEDLGARYAAGVRVTF